MDLVAETDSTNADLVAFIGLDFARLIRFRAPEELRNLARWADAMRSREAAKAGLS